MPNNLWPMARWLVAMVLLIASLMAAFMLALQHLGSLNLPGCGPQSDCAALATGRWGTVLGWPVSFLGAAWFAALLTAWLWAGPAKTLSRWWKWAVRAGAVGSVFFLLVMAWEGHACPYCLVVHGGNLAFWILVERAAGSWQVPILQPMIAGAVMFASATVTLYVVQERAQGEARTRAETQFQASLERIVLSARAQAKLPDGDPTAPEFTGRYRLGPERAAIRIVAISDFECGYCLETERAIQAIRARRGDVSFSVKHFPLCTDCNVSVGHAFFHRNACRAAWAVEAAGVLAGSEGYWRMHHWLFQHYGVFTDEQLKAALPGLGFADGDKFLATMTSAEVMNRVQQDIEDATQLGITHVPMIFLNGVELRGREADQAISRAVETLARENPAARTASIDRPAAAEDRLFDQWCEERPVELPKTAARWTYGPADAKVRIALFACHQNPYAPEIEQALRELVDRRCDTCIDIWQYPVSPRNPHYAQRKENLFPASYDMARAAEAAGQLGGNAAFWKMHDWILGNQGGFSVVKAASAADMGLDREAFLAAADGERVRAALAADMESPVEVDVTWTPKLYIGRRLVRAWQPSAALLERMIDRAVGQMDDSH